MYYKDFQWLPHHKKNMQHRRQWSTHYCPFCECTEDHIHLLQCKSDQTTSHFNTAYGNLNDWLQKTTSLETAKAIYLLLTDHKDNQRTAIVRMITEAILSAQQSNTNALLEPTPSQKGFFLTTERISSRNTTIVNVTPIIQLIDGHAF